MLRFIQPRAGAKPTDPDLRVRAIRSLLAELPERDRNVLRAFYVEGRYKTEICETFGISIPYFRVLVSRVKLEFRSALERTAKPLPDSQAGSVGRPVTKKSVADHALATFGTRKKTDHWMNRPNPLFDGKAPAQVLESDADSVEAELVRIDHGVYV